VRQRNVGSISTRRQETCLFSEAARGPGTNSASFARAVYATVRRSGSIFDRSPPFSAEVKNEWNYTSISLICLREMHRDIFTFHFFYLHFAWHFQNTQTFKLWVRHNNTQLTSAEAQSPPFNLLCLLTK